MQPKAKKIIIATGIFFALIIIVSIFFIIDNIQRSVKVEFMVAPASAVIELNGEKKDNYTEYKIRPGEYHITIKKDGYFEPYEETVVLNAGDSRTFYIPLQPLENTDWYAEHPEDSLPIDTIEDESIITTSDYYTENYPLINALPITVQYYASGYYVYYVISFKYNESGEPIVLIKDYTGNNLEEAKNRIRLLGFNPDDYKIEYYDLTGDLTPSKAPNS